MVERSWRATKLEQLAGTITAAANTTYRIEVFLDATQDPSGAGQGQTIVGAVNVTTDGSGVGMFTLMVSALPSGRCPNAKPR